MMYEIVRRTKYAYTKALDSFQASTAENKRHNILQIYNINLASKFSMT